MHEERMNNETREHGKKKGEKVKCAQSAKNATKQRTAKDKGNTRRVT